MKTISIFLALINSLLAGLLIAASLSNNEVRQVASWWLLTKLFAATTVIIIGILTWIGNMTHVRQNIVSLASVYLVALGAATVVWTFHVAQFTGDMEYHMVVYGGSLFVQGVALLLGMSQAPGNITTA
jgi:type IV secretory pathway TraG/TraD family ATPase VirD4